MNRMKTIGVNRTKLQNGAYNHCECVTVIIGSVYLVYCLKIILLLFLVKVIIRYDPHL